MVSMQRLIRKVLKHEKAFYSNLGQSSPAVNRDTQLSVVVLVIK